MRCFGTAAALPLFRLQFSSERRAAASMGCSVTRTQGLAALASFSHLGNQL